MEMKGLKYYPKTKPAIEILTWRCLIDFLVAHVFFALSTSLEREVFQTKTCAFPSINLVVDQINRRKNGGKILQFHLGF